MIIKRSPYEYLFGIIPGIIIRVEGDAYKREALVAKERILQLKGLREELAKRLQKAYNQQGKYYNKRHKPATFQIRDKVILKSTNIKT